MPPAAMAYGGRSGCTIGEITFVIGHGTYRRERVIN